MHATVCSRWLIARAGGDGGGRTPSKIDEPVVVSVQFDMSHPACLSDVQTLCFRLVRDAAVKNVKEEPLEEGEPPVQEAEGHCGPIQKAILKEFVRTSSESLSWSSLDPAVQERAVQDWGHLLQWCQISQLRNTIQLPPSLEMASSKEHLLLLLQRAY